MEKKEQFSFFYDGKKYEYLIIKSKRKSISIFVEKDKKIVVKAPLYSSTTEVQKLVEKKADWIAKKTEEVKELQKDKPVHHYISGEVFYYRGKPLILNLIINQDRNRIMVKKQAGTLLVVSSTSESDVIKSAVIKWYRERAREVLQQKVSYYQKFIGKSVGDIRIKEQKSRWGSCSNKGNLNFNWKILMAEDDIIDYLVVHELCHRLHMDHSKEFWDSVGKIIPDYKTKEKWLKENGTRLDL